MDLSQYLEIFIDESKEHLQTLNDQVLILESEPENVDTVNEIFRAAHSLKGMAGTMGYKRMQRLTHDMENVFSEIRNGKMNVNADLVDIVFKCLDALEGYLTNIIETSDEGTEDNDELIAQLNAVLQNGLHQSEFPEVVHCQKDDSDGNRQENDPVCIAVGGRCAYVNIADQCSDGSDPCRGDKSGECVRVRNGKRCGNAHHHVCFSKHSCSSFVVNFVLL